MKSGDPDLGGRKGGGDKVGVAQVFSSPSVQLIREVYLQCKEKLIRAICVNFVLVRKCLL